MTGTTQGANKIKANGKPRIKECIGYTLYLFLFICFKTKLLENQEPQSKSLNPELSSAVTFIHPRRRTQRRSQLEYGRRGTCSPQNRMQLASSLLLAPTITLRRFASNQ